MTYMPRGLSMFGLLPLKLSCGRMLSPVKGIVTSDRPAKGRRPDTPAPDTTKRSVIGFGARVADFYITSFWNLSVLVRGTTTRSISGLGGLKICTKNSEKGMRSTCSAP
jgi:hypothetical protein